MPTAPSIVVPPRPDRGHVLRAGTRGSPLALIQTRAFLAMARAAAPGTLFEPGTLFKEDIIRTTGDAVQDRRLAEIGGKGLFAKEIHEALADGRIDVAVHSLKDLETELPAGIVLGATLTREDARDALILGPACAPPDPAAPYACLPRGAAIGTSSPRRQAQMLHARPDLRVVLLRGNVRTRLDHVRGAGGPDASLLALAGLRRLDMADAADAVLDVADMVPAACQGIVGVTVREADTELRALLAAIEDQSARVAATAERALLAALDGSCTTPIGAYARTADGMLHVTGLVARPDGSFLLRRTAQGAPHDAARLGTELGESLRADSPTGLFD